ncbi:MAG: DNA-deoxyinosine glycosylase [Alphaproteobacteria bacterium]|nr:DNA-deoxyinosine glycosylase [Alphaproteobacteria bacterium]
MKEKIKNNLEKKCLEPWIDENTRILIVGTMPGEQSIQEHMYYANPHNKFWSYIEKILNKSNELKSEEERKRLLQKYNIGLWDALSVCEREGSLDSKITKEQYNDFSKFQSVQYVLFNGKKAQKYFEKYNAQYLEGRQFKQLPSTSPANASISEAKKFEQWNLAIKSFIKKPLD